MATTENNLKTYVEEWCLEMTERGEFEFEERSKQRLLFKGLRYENITPTDIDMLIEYKNIAYIIGEVKYGDVELKNGQKIALVRMVDDFKKRGKKAICLVIQHAVEDCNEDVIIADGIVREYYYNGIWRKTNRPMTTKEICDDFIKKTG